MSEDRLIAKIRSARLGYEDHGILTVWLDLEYGGGSCQGAGGYALDSFDKETDRREGTAYGLEFVMRLMAACGVEEWSQIPGRTVFAIRDGERGDGRVIGISPLPTEPGEPFIFEELAAKYREKAPA